MEWKRVVAEFEKYVYSEPGMDIEGKFRELAKGKTPLEIIDLYGVIYGYDSNMAISILSRFPVNESRGSREPEPQWQLAEFL